MARPYAQQYGPEFGGYRGNLNDRTMDPRETDQLRGVLCNEGGVLRAFGTVKSSSVADHVSSAAEFDVTTGTYLRVGSDAGDFPLLGMRWTILGAFKPTTPLANSRIFDRVVTISGSPYHAPSLYMAATGELTLAWTKADGTDKSITSTNQCVVDTAYMFIARRNDDALSLHVATLTSVFAEWASGTGLGVDDFPADAGTHYFVLGANGTNDPPDSDHFEGVIDGITVLEFALGDDELDVGYLEWPAPRMDRCLVHLPLDEAAGEAFTNHSSQGLTYLTDHEANIAHQASALVLAPTVVNFIGETRDSTGRQFVNVIADGNLYSSRTNT
jgi:hypothetical protein